MCNSAFSSSLLMTSNCVRSYWFPDFSLNLAQGHCAGSQCSGSLQSAHAPCFLDLETACDCGASHCCHCHWCRSRSPPLRADKERLLSLKTRQLLGEARWQKLKVRWSYTLWGDWPLEDRVDLVSPLDLGDSWTWERTPFLTYGLFGNPEDILWNQLDVHVRPWD